MKYILSELLNLFKRNKILKIIFGCEKKSVNKTQF